MTFEKLFKIETISPPDHNSYMPFTEMTPIYDQIKS